MFLDKLDFLMSRDGYNKNSFAKKCGVPYTTIDGFYKKGYDNAKLSTLKKIADFFDVTLDFLVRDSEEKAISLTASEVEHIKKYRQLDVRGQAAVEGTLAHEFELMRQSQESDLLSEA